MTNLDGVSRGLSRVAHFDCGSLLEIHFDAEFEGIEKRFPLELCRSIAERYHTEQPSIFYGSKRKSRVCFAANSVYPLVFAKGTRHVAL